MLPKSRALFKNRFDRDVEAVRLYDCSRQDNIKKIEKFVKSHNLQHTYWEPTFDKITYSNTTNAVGDAYAIMFSGGIDSLSLALRHLENNERVFLISVGFQKEEQCSAWLTAQILKKIYGSDNVTFLNVFSSIVLTGEESTYGLCQQSICAFYAAWIPAQVMTTIKAVECAYVMNDDALSFLEELKTVYHNTMRLKYYTDDSVAKTPLNFPLTQTPHYKNAEYIATIEERYNVIFPTLSAEHVQVQKLESTNDIVYIIEGGKNQEKPNKECPVHAYIFIEHFKKLKDVLEKDNDKSLRKSESDCIDTTLQ